VIALVLGLEALLAAASGQVAVALEPATVEIRSANVAGPNSMSEPQYQELLRCSLAKNEAVVEAWIDSRFELGKGLEERVEEEFGKAPGLKSALDGCLELKTGSLPFSLDRLSRDWADHFGVSKADPNTLDSALGITRVSNLDELVDYIRARNASEAIHGFLAMPSNAPEKAPTLARLIDKCAPSPGASVRADVEGVEQALGHEKVS